MQMEYFIDFNHDKIKVFYDYKCEVVVRGGLEPPTSGL